MFYRKEKQLASTKYTTEHMGSQEYTIGQEKEDDTKCAMWPPCNNTVLFGCLYIIECNVVVAK